MAETSNTIINFVVYYYFIDNTYWDDGNRCTSRNRKFKSYDKAIEFANSIREKTVTAKSNVTSKTDKFWVDKDSIRIEKETIERIPWWVMFKDMDYIIKELRCNIRYGNYKMLDNIKRDVVHYFGEDKFEECLKLCNEEDANGKS